MLFPADLVRQKNNHATDSDIRIDDVAEDTVGNVLENVCTKSCSDDDAAKSETVICQDGGGDNHSDRDSDKLGNGIVYAMRK